MNGKAIAALAVSALLTAGANRTVSAIGHVVHKSAHVVKVGAQKVVVHQISR